MFLNIQGFLKNKSLFNGINLGISLSLLMIHLNNSSSIENWKFCVICDLTFLAISIGLYLYVNDIEVRRKVISEVFENRYRKESERK